MLDKSILIAALQQAFDKTSDVKVNPADARAQRAIDLADAIDAYIRSGTVTVAVTTTGGPNAQAGTGTGSVS